MSTKSNDCNDGSSKLNDDGVCEVVDMLQNISTASDNKDSGVSNTCANCGKEGSDVMNTCNKCKMVMYCNAACKKKHRTKHKKQCERRVAELHDEKLFKQPTLLHEDCPICFIRMPPVGTGSKYKPCCGKVICSGCIHAVKNMKKGPTLCPFCRIPAASTDEDYLQRTTRRVEAGDTEAIFNLGVYYAHGMRGLPHDYAKALELWHKAGELKHAKSYCNIGSMYYIGRDVEKDTKKAKYYYELAAMEGCADARHNIGLVENHTGNTDRAIKHFMIAASVGYIGSLKMIQRLYSNGLATKEVYTAALQAYQEYFGQIKSIERDKAAAHSEKYRY